MFNECLFVVQYVFFMFDVTGDSKGKSLCVSLCERTSMLNTVSAFDTQTIFFIFLFLTSKHYTENRTVALWKKQNRLT